MKAFELIEHTADIGIRARGHDLKELFGNAALGMLSIMVDPSTVHGFQRVEIHTEAADFESLFIEFLSEILFLFETRRFVPSSVQVLDMMKYELNALLIGEPLDEAKHELRLGIKAVTYHMLKIERRGFVWQAEVIFDV